MRADVAASHRPNDFSSAPILAIPCSMVEVRTRQCTVAEVRFNNSASKKEPTKPEAPVKKMFSAGVDAGVWQTGTIFASKNRFCA